MAPKLIPISSNQMKAMGIVQSKNGYLMREHKPSKPVAKTVGAVAKKEINNGSKKESRQEKRQESSKEEVTKEIKPRRVTEVVVVQRNEKQAERKRMEDRGIY